MDKAFERVVQEAVTEVVASCPWMDEADVARVETVFTAHVGLVAGEAVDVGVMAAALSGLAQRAEAAGDRRRAWDARAVVSVGVCVAAGGRNTAGLSFRQSWRPWREGCRCWGEWLAIGG